MARSHLQDADLGKDVAGYQPRAAENVLRPRPHPSKRWSLQFPETRAVLRLGTTQVLAAKRWKIPRPTLSKIINGQTDSLSIELLVRIAVRAGLSLTLHTGEIAEANFLRNFA
jgi:hypothetical protein